MKISSLKQNKTRSHYIVISTLLILLFISPISVFAQDPDSIATLRRMGKAFASIAEKTSPAVISLKAERTITREYPSMRDGPFGEPFSDPFEFFFRRRSPRQRSPQRQYQEPRTAQGSGFIISADGYILTNNHMVAEAEKVEIELTDGRKFTAKIIGADSDSDVAVVKIDASDLPYLELADSDALEVGEWVLAIGNPLGLSHTVTAGIVSAKGRSGFGLADFENFIQTDAAINFGNSGGPLINLDGKVVGINTAIAGSSGNIGLGFAIPINMAKHAYDQLVKGGTVERGYLGIGMGYLTDETAPFFGLKKNAKGVLISEVIEDSAADKAGLKHNDVVIEFNGEPIESREAFRNQVAMLKPGTRINLVVWRDRKRKAITVKLGKRPSTEEITGNLSPETVNELGFTVEDLTPELAEQYGYEGQSGVLVKEVERGSQAEQKIAPGALIKEVNQQRVRNTREFNDAIKEARKDGAVLLLVKWRGYNLYVPLKLSEK